MISGYTRIGADLLIEDINLNNAIIITMKGHSTRKIYIYDNWKIKHQNHPPIKCLPLQDNPEALPNSWYNMGRSFAYIYGYFSTNFFYCVLPCDLIHEHFIGGGPFHHKTFLRKTRFRLAKRSRCCSLMSPGWLRYNSLVVWRSFAICQMSFFLLLLLVSSMWHKLLHIWVGMDVFTFSVRRFVPF